MTLKIQKRKLRFGEYLFGVETGHLHDDSVSFILLQQKIWELKQRRRPRQWKRRSHNALASLQTLSRLFNLSNAGAFSWSCILKDFIQFQNQKGKFVSNWPLYVHANALGGFIIHVVVVQWTPDKCSKKLDAWRAECRAVLIKTIVFWLRRSLFQGFR